MSTKTSHLRSFLKRVSFVVNFHLPQFACISDQGDDNIGVSSSAKLVSRVHIDDVLRACKTATYILVTKAAKILQPKFKKQQS